VKLADIKNKKCGEKTERNLRGTTNGTFAETFDETEDIGAIRAEIIVRVIPEAS
jgi:hypothetical protein